MGVVVVCYGYSSRLRLTGGVLAVYTLMSSNVMNRNYCERTSPECQIFSHH